MALRENGRPRETLGLVGDGDDVDLIEAVERSFGVTFGDETACWSTAGDIHDALLTRRPPTVSTSGLCATSMAFYRLRAILMRHAETPRRITPQDKLRDVTALSRKQLMADLGLHAPPLTLSWRGAFALAGVLGGLVATFAPLVIASTTPWWPGLLAVPLGWAIAYRDEQAHGSATVGDLARGLAAYNAAHFTALSADARPAAIWQALQRLLADVSDRPADHIGRDTRLLGAVRRPAA